MKFIQLLFISSILFFSCEKSEPEPLPIYDTRVSPHKILDVKFKINSRTNLFNSNTVTQSFTLPHRTLYWSYWIGVGNEPVESLAKVIIPVAMSKVTQDPFIAYGLKGIAALNTINTINGNVDIVFLDADNEQSFSNGKNYNFLPFFKNDNVKSIYAIRETMADPITLDKTLYIGLTNNNLFSAENVTLKIWAYVIKE